MRVNRSDDFFHALFKSDHIFDTEYPLKKISFCNLIGSNLGFFALKHMLIQFLELCNISMTCHHQSNGKEALIYN